jgi:hypothetical protein
VTGGGDAALIFDPRMAEFPTRTLPADAVVDLLPLSHVPERVAAYRDRMRAGDRFPPISVIRVFGRYVIADGHKRYSAYRLLGAPEIVVEVWPLTRWLRDQWRQAADHAHKNARIVSVSITDPRQAGRLLLTTVLHWRRVASSLIWRTARRHR